MIWRTISQNSPDPFVLGFNAKDYQSISADHVHPMVQTLFSDDCIIFERDNAPIHVANAIENRYKEPKSELDHLEWLPQSPDFNIIKYS